MGLVLTLNLGCLAGTFPDKARSARATFRASEGADDDEVNPMRGLYTWYGENAAPQARLPFDAYTRYGWRALERGDGDYDFAVIDRDLEQAERDGQKLGFRVMAVNEWEGETQVPDDLRAAAGGRVCNRAFVPNWDSPIFIDRARKLVAALGKRYDGDRRLAYVDIGIYGHWGEWHTWGLCGNEDEAAFATKKALIDAHVEAFPNTRLLMVSGGVETEGFVYAMGKSARIGVRCDALGDVWFREQFTGNSRKHDAMRDRWKTAPFIAEFIGPPRVRFDLLPEHVEFLHVAAISNGNAGNWSSLSREDQHSFLQAAKRSGYRLSLTDVKLARAAEGKVKVTIAWRNQGVTPVYEPFDVIIDLRSQTGERIAHAVSKLKLSELLPTTAPVSVEDQLTFPAGASGGYAVFLTIVDPQGYRQPLRLADRKPTGADGGYQLGAVDAR